MKKRTVYFFLLFTSYIIVYGREKVSAVNTSPTIITGNVPEKNQKIYLLRDPISFLISNDKATDSVIIDEVGHFIINSYCSSDSKYILRIGDRYLNLTIFCKDGDSIVIEQMNSDSEPKIIFDKGGATKFYNSFLTRFSLNQEYWTNFQKRNWQECYAILDNREQMQNNFLTMNTNLLSTYPALKRNLEDVVRYQASYEKLTLLNYHYYDGKDSILIHDKQATNFIDSLKFKTDNQELTTAYISFLNIFLEFPFKRWRIEIMHAKDLTREERFSLRFEFCKMHLIGRSRDYGMFYSLATLFTFVSDSIALKVAEKQQNDFKHFVTDKRYLELYNNTLSAKLAVSKGRVAPNFTLPDITSRNVSLSDFKGKTVYMEFTGTWCGPCRKEIPAIKELQQKCKDNPNIQFLTVWLEGAELPSPIWANYIQENGLEGVHLYSKSQFNGEVPRMYQINGVPAFMIIDKNGKIASSSTKRPSEEGVYEDIIQISGQ